jgi:DNA mismatch repair protein MSH3
MAPKSSQSSSQPKPSQKGTQQTISSFFARKPSQTPKPASKPAPKAPSPPVPNDTHQEDDDDDDEDSLPVPRSIPVRKRAIDEDDDDVPDSGRSSPSKRVRFEKGDSPRQTSAPKVPRITDKTSKFLFSSSPPPREENREEDEEDVAASQKQKERLHEKFVKKLGRPDSFAELRRRNKIISEDNPNANGEEGDGDEEEEEEPPQKPAKGKKGAATKKANKLTPMEIQYLDIKRKHLDTIIVMEVGYKYKFFGEDARTASKELGIVCIPGKNSKANCM